MGGKRDERAQATSDSKQRTGLGFVIMLLLSSLGALATVPVSSAALPGSIGITDSLSPRPDAWYSAFDTLDFSAEVTNYYASASGATRTLTWYAWMGHHRGPVQIRV